MLTSSVSVRPTFTTRFCKFVRSIFGFTEKEKLQLLILTQCEIPYTIHNIQYTRTPAVKQFNSPYSSNLVHELNLLSENSP